MPALAGLLIICLLPGRLPAQQTPWLTFESMEANYPLIKVKQSGRTYYYHLESGVLVDKTANHAADMVVVVKDGRYGVLREDGLLIVPCEYDAVKLETSYDGQWYEGINYNYTFIILKENSLFGVADHDGRVIVPPQYTAVNVINKHVIGVELDGLWGWVDAHTGKMLQAPAYQKVDGFMNSDYVKLDREGNVGLARNDGTLIIHPEHRGFLRAVHTQHGPYIQVTKTPDEEGSGERISLLYDTLGNVKLTGFEGLGSMYHADFMTFEKDRLKGAVDPRTGAVVADPVYDRFDDGVRGLFLVKQAGMYGVLDGKGTVVLPAVYDALRFINVDNETKSSPMSRVDGTVGSPLPQDEWQVAIREYRAFIDSQDYFIRAERGRSVGIFDWQGNEVVPLEKYNDVMLSFHKTPFFFAHDSENGNLVIGNADGEEIAEFPYLFDRAYRYGNSAIENDWELRNRYVSLQQRAPEGESATEVCLYDLEKAKIAVPMGDQHINWLDERFFKVRNRSGNGETSLYTKEGELVVTFPAPVSDLFVVGPNHLLLRADGRYRLADMEGRILYENAAWRAGATIGAHRFPEHGDTATGVYHHGLMKRYMREDNLFLDEEGREVQFEAYDAVDEFYTGVALACIEVPDSTTYPGYGYRYGLIDVEGKEVHPMEWERVYEYTGNADLLTVVKDGKQGLIDRSGSYRLDPVYDFIEPSGNFPNLNITKDGKSGLATEDGRILLEPRYDELRRNPKGEDRTWPVLVREGDWFYFLDKEGKPLPVRSKQYSY